MTFKSPSKQLDIRDWILNILIVGVAIYIVAVLLFKQDVFRQNIVTLFMVKTPTITPPYPYATKTPVRKPTWTLSPKDAATETYLSTRASVRKTQIYSDIQTRDYRQMVEIPATEEARGINCKAGFVLEMESEILHASNDQWTIFTCSPDSGNITDNWTPGVVDFGTRYTQIVKTDRTKTWTIIHSTFDFSRINRPDALLIPYCWSGNGKYVYVYPDYYPGPSGGFKDSFYLGTRIDDLYRLNLQNGDFEPVLLVNTFADFEISPDGNWLIYSETDRPDVMHLRDLNTNSETEIRLNKKIIAMGAFTWSRDSSSVLIFAGYGKNDGDMERDLSATEVYKINLQNMTLETLIPEDERLFVPCASYYEDAWYSTRHLCIQSIRRDPEHADKNYSLDIETGKVIYMNTRMFK